ncbi:MAG: patatin-like phospholipase family protein [Pseudomonadota bacterium]
MIEIDFTRVARIGGTLLFGIALSACTTVLVRSPVPAEDLDHAKPYGIAPEGGVVRIWGDENPQGDLDKLIKAAGERMRLRRSDDVVDGQPIQDSILALSGGGPDGAFGAGLLKGWTDRGDRPKFQVVTGVSTGAIIALFAFLGPDYDEQLREIYTTFETDQLLTPTIFAALTGGTAFTDTRGYRGLIENYVSEEIVEKLAQEANSGRALLVGTTNMDASRPVIWNVTRIAASGHPDARRLIHDIIQASSAIPAVFPPVLIPVVTEDGKRHDEMHVDGGATQQVMFLTPQIPITLIDKAAGLEFDRTMYIIMNNKLQKSYAPVRPRVLSIAGAAVSSLIGGSGSGDVYRIFAVGQRDDIDLNLTWIPQSFDLEPEEPFDKAYMTELYQLGYEQGLSGERWAPHPPDFRAAE